MCYYLNVHFHGQRVNRNTSSCFWICQKYFYAVTLFYVYFYRQGTFQECNTVEFETAIKQKIKFAQFSTVLQYFWRMQLRVNGFEITCYLEVFWESMKCHEVKVLAFAVTLGHDTRFMHIIARRKAGWRFLNFKLSPCFDCSLYSFVYVPGVIVLLYADVLELSIGSIF